MPPRRVVDAASLAITAVLGTACPADDPSPAGSSSGSSDAADESSSGAGATGTVTLSFGVSAGVREGPTLVDPLMGSVYGDLFHTGDVALTGPVDGAEVLGSVALEGVDLTTAEVSTVSWTSEPLPAGDYTFLGMLDVDGNFETTDHNPDSGDPVTLTNQDFLIAAGQDSPFTVMFELVYG